MYKELKPTIIRDNFKYDDYYEHRDVMELDLTYEECCESENIEDKFEHKRKVQRFPVIATEPNLILDNTDKNYDVWDHGWNLDERCPSDIVRGFSNIQLNPEYKLIGYRFISGGNGHGIVWAIPKDIRASEVYECELLKEYAIPLPKPREALEDYMEGITGDKSPLSYLQAAIVNHELAEYGAAGHGVSWRCDIILPLSKERIEYMEKNKESLYKWEMIKEEPEILYPHFYLNENEEPVIVFYTINDIGVVTFNEYKHTFTRENYTMKIERTVLGTAGVGIIF